MDNQKAFQDYYPDDYGHCYGCGRLNPHGLQIKSYWDGDETVATFMPQPYHTAMPGFVYGGLIASLIDCHSTGSAAAAAYRAAGRAMDSEPPLRYVTASLKVDYLRPTPMGVLLELRGRIKEIKGRKVVVETTLAADGEVCARGEVVAVQLPENMISAGAEKRAPAAAEDTGTNAPARVEAWNAVIKERYAQKKEPQQEIVALQSVFQKRGVKKVLDLGCGSGRHLVYLARAGYDVFGIDVSPEAIRLSRQWLAEEGLNAELRCQDMKRLPWPDNFFDAVISVLVIEHNRPAEIRQIIREVNRVLCTGGGFFAMVKKHPPRRDWKDGKFIEVGHHLYAPTAGTEKGIAHYFFIEDELKDILTGFAPLEIHPDKKGENYCALWEKQRR